MIDDLIIEAEEKLGFIYKNIEDIEYFNSKKIIEAMQKYEVSEADFASSTGYGYGDMGRDKIEKIYAEVFKTEDALVRNQFISGTHAISTALFAVLRPGDTLLSITGKPYDTLDPIIGFAGNDSSLKSFNINYEQIDLINNDFNYEEIEKYLKKKKPKLIAMQRSRGYSLRKSLSMEKVEKVIKFIKDIDADSIILVDNCYCELVSKIEPSEVGADLTVGSLIKNLGGGIATNGGYIVGSKKLIHLCSERLNVAGEAKEVGPSQGANINILKGLYLAPQAVASALKTAVLASFVMDLLGFRCDPIWNEPRADIVQMIYLQTEENLIDFVQGIQMGSAIDSSSLPVASPMPGYSDKIIMASGSFTQGSSIELSCDAPLKAPYRAYLQGSLSYSYGKIGLKKAIENLKNIV